MSFCCYLPTGSELTSRALLAKTKYNRSPDMGAKIKLVIDSKSVVVVKLFVGCLFLFESLFVGRFDVDFKVRVCRMI